MSSQKRKWPDLSTYGVYFKRWMGATEGETVEQGQRCAVIQPIEAEMDDKLKSTLEEAGFEAAWIDGQEVMRRQGEFGSADLMKVFPDIFFRENKALKFKHYEIDATNEAEVNEVCNIRGEFGPAPSIPEEPVAEEVSTDDADFDAAFEGMLGTLADELGADENVAEEADAEPEVAAEEPVKEPEPQPEVKAEDVAPVEVAVETLEPVPAPRSLPEPVEVVAEAPTSVTNVAASDLNGELEGFEDYLVYHGIPKFVRAEFVEALPRLIEFLKEREEDNSIAKNAWKELQNPASIRQFFKEECASSDRRLAKANIIDNLYPLAFDYVVKQNDPELREDFSSFAATHKDGMDAFTDWYIDYAQTCMNEDNKAYSSQMERGIRAWGSRVAFKMCEAGKSKVIDKVMRENDLRFIAMCSKGESIINNTKQGFINPIRKNDVRRAKVVEKFESLVPKYEAETPGMTA
jgi:hypothetical protein